MVFEGVEGHEGARARDQFMGELCLVVGVLDALVVVLCIAWNVCQRGNVRTSSNRGGLPKPNIVAVMVGGGLEGE